MPCLRYVVTPIKFELSFAGAMAFTIADAQLSDALCFDFITSMASMAAQRDVNSSVVCKVAFDHGDIEFSTRTGNARTSFECLKSLYSDICVFVQAKYKDGADALLSALDESSDTPRNVDGGYVNIGGKQFKTRNSDFFKAAWHVAHPAAFIVSDFLRAVTSSEVDVLDVADFVKMGAVHLDENRVRAHVQSLRESINVINKALK